MLLFFGSTLFVSAFLLFLVQPMVGKMILPSLGGTPAVWNTCMVFFQAALLAGYAYAHGSVAWLGVRRQAGVHVLLSLLPLLLSVLAIIAVLPIAIDMDGVPSSEDNPVFWLLGRLLLGVGLPFFIISSNAPLLQRWFSRTGHSAAKDPYFLYAASNLGSLVALLGYPILVEPLLPLTGQSWAWAGGYVALAVMVLGCAVALWRSNAASSLAEEEGIAATKAGDELDGAADTLTVCRRLRWIVLAFVPSSLMLGVTTHVTTDIAPVPLLWVIPLALYLLSFVFVFASRPPIPHAWVCRVLPLLVVPVAIMTVHGKAVLGLLAVPVHLLMFFAVALACHGEMAKDRPPPRHLTHFYLLMSVGGVLGGLFNAVVAPLSFNTAIEYPLVMVLACVVLVRRTNQVPIMFARVLDFGVPVLAGLAMVGILYFTRPAAFGDGWPYSLSIGVPAVLCLMWIRRPLRLGLTLGAVLLATSFCVKLVSGEVLYTSRNFYGVKKVTTDQDDHFHTFVHGATIHGIQSTHPKGRRIPRTYFHPSGPVGDVFRTFNSGTRQRRVAIIGLGVGSMASYAQPAQHFTFYEIDPEVARVAGDTRLFTAMDDCLGKQEVVLGDGRLALAHAADESYGLIVLDVFSSDAIPPHFLTREAIELYLRKLGKNGFLAFHVSNAYVNLEPLLANLAEDAGLVCLSRTDPADDSRDQEVAKYPSTYVVMARQLTDIRRLDYDPKWRPVPTVPALGVWTDQYTSVFRLLKWNRAG